MNASPPPERSALGSWCEGRNGNSACVLCRVRGWQNAFDLIGHLLFLRTNFQILVGMGSCSQSLPRVRGKHTGFCHMCLLKENGGTSFEAVFITAVAISFFCYLGDLIAEMSIPPSMQMMV